MIEDVELLLKSHGIKYQKKGHIIKCLCPNPNHIDKHIGSFSFDLNKGLGHCFACDYSVNVRSFNRILGEHLNRESNQDFNYYKSLKPKKEIIEYPKPIIYGKLYNPKTNNQVMDFLHSIGLSDDFIDRKEIKYCRYCEMIAENLVNVDDEKPTPMKERICIPIYKDGKLVNYECRSFVGEEPKVKYVNGCKVNMLFNYENIDLNKEVVLTESIKNLGKGYNVTKNIISSFGNQITEIKMEMLNKIPNLIIFADYDDGGLLMLQKLKEGYNGNLKVTFCPKKYRDSKGEIKGKDMNDCSLEEIKFYLEHTMSVEKALNKFENKEESIFWN